MGKFDPFQGHAAKKSGVEITAAQAQAGVRLKQEGTPCFAHIMFSRSRKATSETEAKKETKAEAKAKTQKQFDNEAQCFSFSPGSRKHCWSPKATALLGSVEPVIWPPVACVFQPLLPVYGLLVGKVAGKRWLLGDPVQVGFLHAQGATHSLHRTKSQSPDRFLDGRDPTATLPKP